MSSEALPYNVQYIIILCTVSMQILWTKSRNNINHDGQSSRGV
jgi:hypothetical protein